MCFLDLEPCTVFRETFRTAIKPYYCDTCGIPISKGEKYLYHFSVYDGRAQSERACALCAEAKSAFGKAHDYSEPLPSSLVDCLYACVDGVVEPYDAETLKWFSMLEGIRSRSCASSSLTSTAS